MGDTFDRILEEVTLPLGRGDLFVLYTDGISEAMNAQGDCFGDQRLVDLAELNADLPSRRSARVHSGRRPRLCRRCGAARRHDDGAAQDRLGMPVEDEEGIAARMHQSRIDNHQRIDNH